MGIINWIRVIITWAIMGGVLLASLIAIIDAARMPARAFVDAGRRPKKIWMLILGAGLLFSVLGVLQMIGLMLNIIAIVPAAIYWYGIRSELKPQSAYSKTSNGNSSRISFPKRGNRNGVRLSPLDSRAAGNPADPRFDV